MSSSLSWTKLNRLASIRKTWQVGERREVRAARCSSPYATPELSTAIGLLLYTHRTLGRRANEELGLKQKLQSLFLGSF